MRYFLRVCLSATSLLYGASTTADSILIDPSGEVNGKVSGLTQEQKPTSLVDEILGGIASSSKISEQLIAEQCQLQSKSAPNFRVKVLHSDNSSRKNIHNNSNINLINW